MGAWKAPKAPDPYKVAAAQQQSNRESMLDQQWSNMIDQEGPDGSLKYVQTGERRRTDAQGNVIVTPSFTAQTTLAPMQQAIKTETDGAELKLGKVANQSADWLLENMPRQIDLSGAPPLQRSLFGLNKYIGKGHNNQIGGNYSDTVGNGYNSNFSGNIGGSFSNTLGDGYQTSIGGEDDFSADRLRVENALKARGADDLAASRRNVETQLIGRGVRPGTAAWNSEMDRVSRAENDFNMAAILAGGQEQRSLFGLRRDAAQFGNDAITNRFQLQNGASAAQAQFARDGQLAGNASEMARFQAQNGASLDNAAFRNNAALQQSEFENRAAVTEGDYASKIRSQYLNEAYAEDAHPLQKIIALLSGAQVNTPNFVSTPTASAQAPDLAGMVYKSDQINRQNSNSALKGVTDLAGTAGKLFLSDRRAKTDVIKVGMLENGLPVYSFRYKDGGPFQIGLMADDVERIHPEAVSTGGDGFKRVRYDIAVRAV